MFIEIISIEPIYDDGNGSESVFLTISEIKTIRWHHEGKYSVIEFGEKEYCTKHEMYFYSFYHTKEMPYSLIRRIDKALKNPLSILNK